ncbi:TorF family putative porin [Acinetobacter pragensis]|uniref:Porin n=1 Tax=Acinetobacter pragensis TaxID=1806892 RepID=A0A151XXC0_9GAMM|nr:TorF family putative porin [Acinetobacter pragensis]KYQ70377.1 hypothetical protein AZH43_04955 [Acinetobacter pragensis]
MSNFSQKAAAAVFLALGSLPAMADEVKAPASGTLTGSASILSKYIYRGGVENDDAALQAGLEYAHNSGAFAGYWGSTLDYDSTDDSKDSGFEHDFYIGYGHALNDDWSYKTQLTAYVYQNGGKVYSEDGNEKRRTTGVELLNNLDYKNLSLGLGIMLADVNYSNAGDIYLSAAYEQALPQNFALRTSIGGYIYNNRRDDAIVDTAKSAVFSEARLGLAKPLGKTGAEVVVEYVWGGQDRMGESLDDHTLIGLNYAF